MVQSTCGKYKDVVCVIPINRLDTKVLRLWFEKVMLAINEFFLVVAVSMDNHICNRKMYFDLCDGELKPSIANPTRPGEQLFLLFDFTYNFKNIFNNFTNKGKFDIPTTGHQHLLGTSCKPSFDDIKLLYTLEEEKVLKVAYSLKKRSLYPNSISRTSPQHALSIFHESTSHGLEFYGDNHPSFMETANFVKLVANIWKIMSVRSVYKGHQTRDEMSAPLGITTVQNKRYLQEACELFIQWKQSRCSGLTSETFTACIQTMSAVLALAEYLQQRHGFVCVLTGKFLSDPIEGRFGWYRQVNGGNFFMSVKQLLEAEKKIRVLSILQQQALISSSELTALDKLPMTEESLQRADVNCDWLVEYLAEVNLDELASGDVKVIYYVSGYIARSVSCRRKCASCKELLVAGEETLFSADCLPDGYEELFQMADRGGLVKPTELCFATTALAVQQYTAVCSNHLMKKKFFATSNQPACFVSGITSVLSSSEHLSSLIYHKCLSCHSNFQSIIETAFNCFAKNELKRLNAGSNESTGKTSRKIRKLTSKSSA